MIVVISHPKDPHAAHVLDLLRADGKETLLLDLSDLPDRASLTIDYDHGHAQQLRYRFGEIDVDLAEARSVWWRRPQAPLPAGVTDFDVRAFTLNEWQEALGGLWQLVDAPWMNPPAHDEVAARKALQLKVASQLGLRTPRTLITSDPGAARAFVAELGVGQVIFKTFSCTHAIWRETRLVRNAELDMLDRVRLAPVIFQEFIPAAADLRITIVGEKIFPASIVARGTDYEIDFRMSLGQARTEPCTLPAGIEERLLQLMQRLSIVYGAIDLRRTPAGDYVFLEVNTAGEFLFIEERTGQPIGRAVADWLIRPFSQSPSVKGVTRWERDMTAS
ncbi:MAG TPA: alpha-L-glutamate ligase [Thermoanaerobaculia bacterium]|nr:alpha-L-glutamate ligase [Thermoanaerobaculia bacterium]